MKRKLTTIYAACMTALLAAGFLLAFVFAMKTGVEETITVFEWRLLNMDGTEANSSVVSNYGKWMTLEFYFPENADYDISFINNVIGTYPIGSTEHNYFANFRIQNYAAAPDELVDFVPAEQLAEEYAQGDEIAFDLVYSDPIGRKTYIPTTEFTVNGGAHCNEDGKVVTMLGEATVSYTIGDNVRTYTLNGPRQMTVPYTSIIGGRSYDNYGAASVKAKVEYKDLFMGHEDIAFAQCGGSSNFGVGFETIYQNAIPAGAYIYFDFFANMNVSLWTGLYANKNTNMSTSTDVKAYSSTGESLGAFNANPNTPSYNNPQNGVWIQVEMLPTAHVAKDYSIWSVYGYSYNGKAYVGFANVVVSLDRIVNTTETENADGTTTTVISRDAMKNYTTPKLTSAEFGGTINMTEKSTLGLWVTSNAHNSFKFGATTEEIGGVAAGDAYKSTQRTAASMIMTPTTAIWKLNSSTDKFGNGRYFYLDVYMTGEVELAVLLGWNYAHKTDWLYGGTANTYCASITCYAQNGTVLKSYNEDGTEKKCADLSDRQFWNQWITIEIKCNGSAASSFSANGIWINNALADGTELYFKDYIFTNQKRVWA